MNHIGPILKQLFAAYPNAQVAPETVAVYLRLLADIAPEDLQVVVDQAIATCKFLPTVAELRDMQHALRSAGSLTWGEAWERVQLAMREVGSYGTPRFRDELTQRVVTSIGWRNLCASENPVADRAQFRDMYTALAQRQTDNHKLLPAARDWSERNNYRMLEAMPS